MSVKRSKLFYGALTLCVIAGAVLALILRPDNAPIPNDVKKQVISTILVPVKSGFSVDRSSAKYDKVNKYLTFNIKKDGKLIAVITEQSTPDTFTDIPTFAEKFFQHAGEYKTFESINGTVHLLHPEKGLKDAAAMNAKGTLLFVNPRVSLSEDDWRRLFQSMVVVQ